MFRRNAFIGWVILGLGAVPSAAHAGIYTTIDTPEETRFSHDYDRVFRFVLADLKSIALEKPERNPPIRRRYVLMEVLARDGTLQLKTLEQKLDYSAVLILRGKADEAVQMLGPVLAEYPKDNLVLSHYATALFLSSSDDFKMKSGYYMKQTLKNWPTQWNDLSPERQKFLGSLGWEETAFERNRLAETYFERLIVNRLEEEKLRRKKQPVEDSIDPIFLGPDQKPVRFVNDRGEFQAGRIDPAEKKKLPRDAVEIVEQLMIWIPGDERLLWLLGEVLNASAMDYQKDTARNAAIRKSNKIFAQMTDMLSPMRYGSTAAKQRFDVLTEAVGAMRDEREINVKKFGIDDDDKPPETPLTSEQWWRALIVGGITGFAIGLFALWQIQEMRRRRQGVRDGEQRMTAYATDGLLPWLPIAPDAAADRDGADGAVSALRAGV